AYLSRNNKLARGMLFASLVGMIALLIHSTVEFNFYIPANAAYFFVLGAMGIVASTLKSRS
ncbi:MAG: O-antigen ligase family protein, partial [Gammaproteobacteria bacterium]|nr:O-antigen ligase family protein [Gammaproteobacteria bacterium]